MCLLVLPHKQALSVYNVECFGIGMDEFPRSWFVETSVVWKHSIIESMLLLAQAKVGFFAGTLRWYNLSPTFFSSSTAYHSQQASLSPNSKTLSDEWKMCFQW